jgi:hypothetical protein
VIVVLVGCLLNLLILTACLSWHRLVLILHVRIEEVLIDDNVLPGVELPGGVEGERRVLRHLLQVHPSGEQLVLQDGQLDGGSRVAVVLQTACNILHP